MNNIGHYINKESFIHNMHPLVKNFLFVYSFVASLLTNNTLILILLFCSTITIGVLAKLPIKESLKSLKSAAMLIIIFSLVVWPFSLDEGKVLLQIGALKVYSVGVLYGISMSIRFCNIVLMSIYWMMFTSIGEITLGMIKSKIPYKIAFSFSMSLRFVPIVIKDLSIIRDAQKSRSLELDKGSLLSKIKKNVVLLIPLSSKSLGMISQIATSLEARGFGAFENRTYVNDKKMLASDFIVMLIIILIIVTLVYFRLNNQFVLTNRVL